MIDEFTAKTGPAVLTAQINAGGVGFNIQAASVVIICGPQWNPAIEDQAIGRAHRMGQARRVDVHRLLSEDGVDAHMLEITRPRARNSTSTPAAATWRPALPTRLTSPTSTRSRRSPPKPSRSAASSNRNASASA